MLTALFAVIFAVVAVPAAAFAADEADETHILWYAANYTDGHKEIVDFEGMHAPGEEVTVLGASVLGAGADRPGHTFIEWNTQRDGTGMSYRPQSTITIEQETTLYAQWERDTYPITLKANSGTLPYNGEEQEISGFTGVPDGLAIEGLSAQAIGVDIGEYEVEFSGEPTVLDQTGNDVTQYCAVKTIPGTLVIEPVAVPEPPVLPPAEPDLPVAPPVDPGLPVSPGVTAPAKTEPLRPTAKPPADTPSRTSVNTSDIATLPEDVTQPSAPQADSLEDTTIANTPVPLAGDVDRHPAFDFHWPWLPLILAACFVAAIMVKKQADKRS